MRLYLDGIIKLNFVWSVIEIICLISKFLWTANSLKSPLFESLINIDAIPSTISIYAGSKKLYKLEITLSLVTICLCIKSFLFKSFSSS